MNRKLTMGTGALIALGLIFIGITILANTLLRGIRIDLTENHLYTIAPGTENILKNLPEPVNLQLFISERAVAQSPMFKTYSTRVRDFLQELQTRSNGNLHLQVVDPQPFSEDEDRAAELGVRAFPMSAAGDKLYFGLAGSNSTDGRAVIEFFDPSKEEFLEYDVAKLIYQLGSPKKPIVAWLSSLPMNGGMDPMSGQPQDPWYVRLQAQELFTIRDVEPTLTKIDDDVDVLLIAHPKNLPQAALYAIDQFALRGGRILVFVDPDSSQDPAAQDPNNPMAAMSQSRASSLEPLFAAWGLQFNPAEVVVDQQYGLAVGMRAGEAPVRHIGILGLDAASFSKDIVTVGLSSVNVATAGALAPIKGAKTQFEPLLQSSAQAGVLPAARFLALVDPATLRDGLRPTGQRYTLAARVTGNVTTAFPEGVANAATPAPLKASTKPLNVMVFADTDMLADFLWLQQRNFFGQRVAQAMANNGDLTWNAIDNLAGSNDLISIRGRAAFTRPFDRVEALRRNADDRLRAKEQELEQQLQQTEERLTQLESARAAESGAILTPEQQSEIDRFQNEKLRIRKELRDVRRGLEQDIKSLGTRLKLVNILVVPLALIFLALAVAGFRRRRTAAIHMLQRESAP